MSDPIDPILQRARALPDAVEPDHDLWREIEAHLEAEPTDHSPTTAGWRLPLTAVAAGLVAVAALTSLWPGTLPEGLAPEQVAVQVSNRFQDQQVTNSPTMNASYLPDGSPADAYAAMNGGLGQTRMDLAIRVAEQVERLPEETRSVVMKNLHIINKALDDIDTALRENPAADSRQRLLLSMYTEQLTMLGEMDVLLHRANEGIAL